MARVTQEDFKVLQNGIKFTNGELIDISNQLRSDNQEVVQILRDIQSSMVNTFQAYERMSDKLIQMAMVNNGTPNAAASHRAQSAREVENAPNSIPLRNDSPGGNFWDQDEEDDWADGNDTMIVP